MIERTVDGEIAILRLAHGKASAMDLELCEAITSAFASEERASTRAVVLTGTGSIFSAGVDLHRVIEGEAGYLGRFLPALCECLRRLFACPKPVVAAINGHAIAGGCMLAAACDRRIMSEGDVSIGVPELYVGVPFPPLVFEVLRSLLDGSQLQTAVFTGRNQSPEESLRLGLVDELCAPDRLRQEALACARRLGSVPPATYALTKRILRTPVLERAARQEERFAREVAAIWEAPETIAFIRGFVARTIHRK